MKRTLLILWALALTPARAPANEGGPPGPFRHRITGLFSPGRERALREAIAKIPGITLVRLDFEVAEATLAYDPAALFPDAKPEQVVERLDQLLLSASGHTLGVKPLRNVPRERLARIE